MPATYDWTGGGLTALVSDAGNWSGSIAPNSPTDSLDFSGVGLPAIIPLPGFLGPVLPVANPMKSAIFDAASPAAYCSIDFATKYTGGATFDRSLGVGMLMVAGQKLTINDGKTLSPVFADLVGGSLQGAGTVELGGAGVPGSMTLSGNTQISVAKFTIDAQSEIMLGGTADVTGGAWVNNGTMSILGSVELARVMLTNNGTMTIMGDLTVGPTSLTNNGFMDWSSGTMDLVLATIVNNGQFQIVANNLSMTGAGVIEDYGEIIVEQGPQPGLTIDPNLTLEASGVLIVQYGTTTLTGTVVDVEGGTIVISTGARLSARTSTFHTGGGATIIGQGSFTIASGEILTSLLGSTLDVEPAVSLESGAQITGPGSFDFTTSFRLALGGLVNTSVLANQVTFASVAPGVSLTNSKLTMVGFGAWLSGDITLANSTIENTGNFEDATLEDIIALGNAQFLNDAGARYEKMPAGPFGLGTSDFRAAFANWGTFELNGFTRNFHNGFYQYAGTVSLGGGTLGLGNNPPVGNYWLFGGLLVAGGGSIVDGNLINMSGTLDVTEGLFLQGNYTQFADGVLRFDPGFTMVVTGSAAIGGTLVITSSWFTPESGFEATVLSSSLLLGTFDAISAGWTAAYDGSTVSLKKN